MFLKVHSRNVGRDPATNAPYPRKMKGAGGECRQSRHRDDYRLNEGPPPTTVLHGGNSTIVAAIMAAIHAVIWASRRDHEHDRQVPTWCPLCLLLFVLPSVVELGSSQTLPLALSIPH